MRAEHSAQYWIKKLKLAKHPEGGWFSQVFRSSEQIGRAGLPDRFTGNRPILSSITITLSN
jgi:hypothetical protein